MVTFGGVCDVAMVDEEAFEVHTGRGTGCPELSQVNWTKIHLSNTAANSVLIYAWNENLEGGWICPTLNEMRYFGRPLRLDAIAGANRAA
ncbi:hypothetical protein ACIBL3_41450 [Kribbella sp. NPDC050124]|uniref:hypothetical protein n=1 Tax=Kribbella sp. NPDC050124 TaxID=3364114 RepID=UPI0037A8DD63